MGGGEWYVLTSGECYDLISDQDALELGEEVADMIRGGAYYDAFVRFAELAEEYYLANGGEGYGEIIDDDTAYDAITETAPAAKKTLGGKKVAICMGVGILIGLIAVGIMAARMKTVRSQNAASDYVRAGSMQLTQRRDIFLYSHVSRTPRPKSSSSSGGRSGGGSRGGAGGRL